MNIEDLDWLHELKQQLLILDQIEETPDFIFYYTKLANVMENIKSLHESLKGIRDKISKHEYGPYILKLRNLAAHEKNSFKESVYKNCGLVAKQPNEDILINHSGCFSNMKFLSPVKVNHTNNSTSYIQINKYRALNEKYLPNSKLVVTSFDFTYDSKNGKKTVRKKMNSPDLNRTLVDIIRKLILDLLTTK